MLQTPTLRAKTVKYTVPRVAQDEGVESSACDIVAVGSHKVAEDGILDSVVNDGTSTFEKRGRRILLPLLSRMAVRSSIAARSPPKTAVCSWMSCAEWESYWLAISYSEVGVRPRHTDVTAEPI